MSVLAGPSRDVPDATVADLVEAQVRRAPRAVALHAGDVELTYAQLDARANGVAAALRALGVGPDVPVAILAERRAELAVALLGTMKAEGACLPLDPSYPPSRLALMLDDARPPVVLTLGGASPRVPPSDAAVLDVTTLPPADGPPPRRGGADALAFVIYTSGSTGRPKGVLLPHRGLVNHHLAVADLYALGPSDRVLQFCSPSFDVSIEEIFPTWMTGGTVVLRPDDLPVLGADWDTWLHDARVTVLNLPTAYWHEWVHDLAGRGGRVPDSVRLVVVGGEKALGRVYDLWLTVRRDGVRWVNAYGPAETSVLATAYEPVPGAPVEGDPPIGRPLANTTVALLDAWGVAVPDGAVGEIVIGGAGVARGYLGRPELTADRFEPDPAAPSPRARRYRTGDLGRLRPDGNLEFRGRRDEQVKVRGFRVECGEVEAALVRHPAVAEAVVVAREDDLGLKRLVGYVVGAPSAALSLPDVRRFLSEQLPSYMVPAALVPLDALPLNANGKVARDALPDPPGDRATVPPAAMPRTATERTIAAAWSDVLRLDALGLDDDFFALGGHSLQATQVVAALREAFHLAFRLRDLFDAPTVRAFAALIETARRESRPAGPDPLGERGHAAPVPPLERQRRVPGQRLPLTLSQEQMWHLERAADPPGLYNLTALQEFPGEVDEGALRDALALLVARHETLRTAFPDGPAGPAQVVAASAPVPLAVETLPARSGRAAGDELRARVAAQDAAPFAWDTAPLWRAVLYRMPTGGGVLAATFDHLICDGTSAYIFRSELAEAYDAFAHRRVPALRPLPVQYGDFALWQRSWLTEERLAAQVSYWERALAGAPLGPSVPFDRTPGTPTRRISARTLLVPPDRYGRLRAFARATRSTMFVLAAAAVTAACSRMSGRTDVVFSTTLSGRQRSEVEPLIGCFHGVGRLRTDLGGDPHLATVVARTRDSVLGLFEHQDVPFFRVRRAVFPSFPSDGPAVLAAVPTDFQFFHTARDAWTPGTGVVQRLADEKDLDALFSRGHLHPLRVTFLDDGTQLEAEYSYKVDFYDAATVEQLASAVDRILDLVVADPHLRLSAVPLGAAPVRRAPPAVTPARRR